MFMVGDCVVRVTKPLSGVPLGTVCMIEGGRELYGTWRVPSYKTRVLGQSTVRSMDEVNLRLATWEEICSVAGPHMADEKRPDDAPKVRGKPHVVIDPAFSRDGLTPGECQALQDKLRWERNPLRLTPPKPAVRYAFRKNPPVRKPTVHPIPVGWKYSAEQGDGKEFDVLVRMRPAGWTPF